MASKNVDSEALLQAANALSIYIDEVRNNIQRMKDAATDCSDNMGSDEISRKAIVKLEDCIKGMNKTLAEAGELRKKILKKKNEIEEFNRNF